MLEAIRGPQDLRTLSSRQLKLLAAEIRERIIATVAENGGHLGANLGVVELTLALHSVFHSPADKIIWDVGHQCYTHKLLTGRGGSFHTLRCYGGMSGFPKRAESPHDCFDVGHSSTSISAAAGMAIARDLCGENFQIAAVIGDGALTGGMAFEALNHAGQMRRSLLVVLNDNEMSIGRNVGAMSEYLTRLRLDRTLTKARDDLEALVRRIPAIGGSMSRLTGGVKDALKSILPGQLFRELGFAYFGPLDGHNISQLQAAIKDASARSGPVLLHVITQKGRGYEPAESNPAKFHGVGPWAGDQAAETQQPSFSQVFGEAVAAAAADDVRITAVTAAMRDGTGLSKFAEEFPHRWFDVGIAEQHSLTLAAGMAAAGLRPVVALYSSFLQRGYDQVLHDICLGGCPVVIGVDRAGVVGDDGPTHHGVFDISFLRPIPGLTILAPRGAGEMRAMVDWALAQNSPTVIRYPRGEAGSYPEEGQGEITKGQWLRRGRHGVIFSYGTVVEQALAAAARLADAGIELSVVNVRSLKPLDPQMLADAAEQSQYWLTVEDHVLAGGFGSSVLEAAQSFPGVGVHCLGYPDVFVPQGPTEKLWSEFALDAPGIAAAVTEALGSKQRKQLRVADGKDTP